jgi:hypothetical protein
VSPLHLASLLGQADAVRILIEHGTDSTLAAQNNDGVTSDVNSINFGFGVTTRIRRIARMTQMSIPRTRIDWLHLVWHRKVGLQKLYAPLSCTVPILVTTTAIEPGAKVVDL